MAIIGAGPAGLTAAWLLKNGSYQIEIFETESQVGGISKTVERDGWRFDIGGHRFFSKSEIVNHMWDEMLSPNKFHLRPRKSRIFYKNKFFDYPLKPLNALINLGVFETVYCIISFIFVKIFPPKDQSNFEGWVAARFGWRLYRIFFKTYTEKVWGISTTKLQSTWAAQRIKNLSLASAIKDALGLNKKVITSLIEEFKYPFRGPGELWETVATKVKNKNSKINLNSQVTNVEFEPNEIKKKYRLKLSNGYSYDADVVFSSLPLSQVPSLLNAPDKIVRAAEKLRYRDFLIVCIPVISTKELFDDNWIYVHDAKVKVGRIQNYGSWSSGMVKPGTSCLGLEYFVNEGDAIWEKSDSEIIELAKNELNKLNLQVDIFGENSFVIRVKKAYPVYDEVYQSSVNKIKDWLAENHSDWYQLGRNGQHRYNNQDHSMLTSYYAINNFKLGLNDDYWDVNTGEEYHEQKLETRNSPTQIT